MTTSYSICLFLIFFSLIGSEIADIF
jgi:hypothetical protein